MIQRQMSTACACASPPSATRSATSGPRRARGRPGADGRRHRRRERAPAAPWSRSGTCTRAPAPGLRGRGSRGAPDEPAAPPRPGHGSPTRPASGACAHVGRPRRNQRLTPTRPQAPTTAAVRPTWRYGWIDESRVPPLLRRHPCRSCTGQPSATGARPARRCNRTRLPVRLRRTLGLSGAGSRGVRMADVTCAARDGSRRLDAPTGWF